MIPSMKLQKDTPRKAASTLKLTVHLVKHEIQYVTMWNANLMVQRRPEILAHEIKKKPTVNECRHDVNYKTWFLLLWLQVRPTAPFEPRSKIEYRVNAKVVIRSFDFPEENINCMLDLSTVLSSEATVDDCLVTSHLQIPLYQLLNQGSLLSNVADAFLLELTAAAVTVSTSAKGPKMCIKKAGIKRLRRLQKKETHYHQEERKLSKGTKFVRFTPKLL